MRAMPKEEIDIHLRYEGPDVDDGTMSIQDIVPVLQGFSSAYGKLAATDDPRSTHRLRIAAVRPGSATIVLQVWNFLGDQTTVNALTSSSMVATAAYFVVRKITDVVRIKRHVKRQPFKETISPSGGIIIQNIENLTIEVPLDAYELFKSGLIDNDLNKVASPLVPGRIEAAEIELRSIDGTILRERILVEERPYFDSAAAQAVTTTRDTWLIAKLNSLTKSTASGFLYLNDGTRVFYRYLGDNPQRLHHLFGTYDGPVRVRVVANMDESLKVVSVDVYEIEAAQGHLFDAEMPADPPGGGTEGDPSL
jgi:hypothetical protein